MKKQFKRLRRRLFRVIEDYEEPRNRLERHNDAAGELVTTQGAPAMNAAQQALSERIAEIAYRHERCTLEHAHVEPHCVGCEEDWPCDSAFLLAQLDEAEVRERAPVEVHIVYRLDDGGLGGVVAVHATKDEAFEDWDRRTGRGARPDLAAKYGIETWLVQSAARAALAKGKP